MHLVECPRVKNGVINTLPCLKNDREVIDVDAETGNGDVSDNSRVEEVDGVEDGLEGRSAASDKTNANLKAESTGRMFYSLSRNRNVDASSLPIHKKLQETAERRNPNLSRLKFLIEFTEKCLARCQLIQPVRKQEDVLQEVLREPFVPLTEEDEAVVSRAFSNSNRRKVLTTHENPNIEITGQLLLCLRPHAWLNDELIGGRNGYDFISVRRWTTQRKLGYCLIECDKL